MLVEIIMIIAIDTIKYMVMEEEIQKGAIGPNVQKSTLVQYSAVSL